MLTSKPSDRVFQPPEDVRPGGHGPTLRVRALRSSTSGAEGLWGGGWGRFARLRPSVEHLLVSPQLPGPGERLGVRRRLGADPRDAAGGRLGGQDVSETVCGKTDVAPGTHCPLAHCKQTSLRSSGVARAAGGNSAASHCVCVSLLLLQTALGPLRPARGARG